MSARGGELVATDEPAVVTKPLFDAIIVEGGQSDGRLANSASTDQSDWGDVFCETNDLFDQVVTSKEDPRLWRWQFPGYTRCEYETLNPSVVEIADLF